MKAEEYIKKNNLSKHIKGTTRGLSEHYFSTKAMLEDFVNQKVIKELEKFKDDLEINEQWSAAHLLEQKIDKLKRINIKPVAI